MILIAIICLILSLLIFFFGVWWGLEINPDPVTTATEQAYRIICFACVLFGIGLGIIIARYF